MLWTPHPYQQQAVSDIINNDYRQLWLMPGDGKTSCVLDAFIKLKQKGLVSRMLVIAPLVAVYDTWPKEVEKWDQFKSLKTVILHGNDKANSLQEDADIYLINFEGLKWLLSHISLEKSKNKYDVQNFLNLSIDMLVIDELSKCKTVSTTQTKCIKLISSYCEKRVGLTGTPAANNLMAVFGQALVIDQGATFGKSFWDFRIKHFHKPHQYSYEWILSYGAEERIYEALSHSVTKRETDNKGELELRQIDITFNLPPNALGLYDDFNNKFKKLFNNKKETHIMVDGAKLNAVNIAAKTMKLRQLTSGFFYYNNEANEEDRIKNIDKFINDEKVMDLITRNVKHVHFKKAEMLKHLVEEMNGQPLLIFYQFIPEIEMINSVLGYKIPMLTTNSITNDSDLIARWNKGEIPVIMAHPKSMSYSANLQMSGGHICFYSPEIDYELFSQAVQRIYRQGNPNSEVRCYHLLAKDTYDEYAVQRLGEKKDVQDALLKGVLRYIESQSN